MTKTQREAVGQARERLTEIFFPHVKEAIRPEMEKAIREPLDMPEDEGERASFLQGMAAMYRVGDAMKKVEDGEMSPGDAERIFEETSRHVDRGEPASPELTADLAARIPEIERQLATPLSDETVEESLNEEAYNSTHEIVGWWLHRLADHAEANGPVIKTAEFSDCLLPPGCNLGPIEDEFEGLGHTEAQFLDVMRNVRTANRDLTPIRDSLAIIMTIAFNPTFIVV